MSRDQDPAALNERQEMMADMLSDVVSNMLSRIVLAIAPDLAFLASFDSDREETEAINAALAEQDCPIRLVWLDPAPERAAEVVQ